MAYHEMLPQELLDFQRELRNWPMISAEMQAQRDFPAALGACAARLGILLDGMYDPCDLMRMLTKKLYEMRTSTIYVPTPGTQEVRIKVGENEIVLEDVPNTPTLIPSLPKKED